MSFRKTISSILNLHFRSFEDWASWIMGMISFGIIVFLATHLDLYYDEAYTYLDSGRLRNVWSIIRFRIANVHVLNSVLMSVSTLFFPYKDFAIRLPAVLFALFYILLAISFSQQFKNRLLALGLLLFFDQLLLFQSIGRGYGMCATLILATLLVYSKKDEIKNWVVVIFWLLILAIYANYVAIPFVFCFLVYMFVVDFKLKIPSIKRKILYWQAAVLLIGIYGFISVSLEGKPLYGAYHSGFVEAIPYAVVLHFTQFYTPSLWVMTLFISIFSVLILLQFYYGRKKYSAGILLLTTFLLIFILATLGKKPLPTGRALLPFWPLFVVAFMQLFEWGASKFRVNNALRIAFNVILVVGLIYNAVSQIPFAELRNHSKNKFLNALNLRVNPSLEHNADVWYYSQKDEYYQQLPKELGKFSADIIYEDALLKIEEFRDLRVCSVAMKQDSSPLVLTYYGGGMESAHESLTFETAPYQSKGEAIFILPLVSKNSDLMVISSGKGKKIYKTSLEHAEHLRKPNIILWYAREDVKIGTNTKN